MILVGYTNIYLNVYKHTTREYLHIGTDYY